MSVVDELVEQMTRKIVSGSWPPGTMLPSLREFAAETGVSMLTVREAVRILQARGWVETRQGVGTVVLQTEHDSRFAPWSLGASDLAEYSELVEAREAIESVIIELAAQRRTDEQLAGLDRLLEVMSDAGTDTEQFLAADAEFHIVLAEAAHNRILLRSMLAIRSPMRHLMANRLTHELEHQGNLARSLSDHRDIVEALRGAAPARGLEALNRIASRSRVHLSDLEPRDPPPIPT